MVATPFRISATSLHPETGVLELPYRENSIIIDSAVSTKYRSVTDGQTDTTRWHGPRHAEHRMINPLTPTVAIWVQL